MRKLDVRPTLPLILSIALGAAAVLMVRNYITGEKKALHVIDEATCIKCGICFDICSKYKAVEVR